MKIPPIFANPHEALNYKMLDSIKRLEPIKEFSALAPPGGDIANIENLYSKFGSLSSQELDLLNKQLLKNYVTNYKQQTLNTYICGDFRVIKTRVLNEDDRFQNGIVIKAEAMHRASEYTDPQPFPVWIEIILPNAPASAADDIIKGDLLEINKNPFFSSVLFVQRILRDDNDHIMSFTVIPLVYESPWTPPRDAEKFNFKAPKKLNMSAPLPTFKL